MTMVGASMQPPLANDYVVEADGKRRAKPIADALGNQPLLECAVALQVNRIDKCIAALEAMRVNLNRMEFALVLLETGVVERPNRESRSRSSGRQPRPTKRNQRTGGPTKASSRTFRSWASWTQRQSTRS